MKTVLILSAILFTVASPFIIAGWRSMVEADGQEDAAAHNGSSGTLL